MFTFFTHLAIWWYVGYGTLSLVIGVIGAKLNGPYNWFRNALGMAVLIIVFWPAILIWFLCYVALDWLST